jgi:hypothetical protein
MNREITQSSEWVCYNDTLISGLKEGWFTLIEQCVQAASYPTVLFYEKLDENESYTASTGFNLSERDISDLSVFA